MMRLKPSEIRYTQDSIGCRFRNRKSLSETIADIVSGRKSVETFPVMEVYKKDGLYWGKGNRRLYVFKELESRGKLTGIRVSYVGERTKHGTGFTTINRGTSARVRSSRARGVDDDDFSFDFSYDGDTDDDGNILVLDYS